LVLETQNVLQRVNRRVFSSGRKLDVEYDADG
jgi:hypothetical protein